MAATANADRLTPPYGPFETVKNFIGTLDGTVVPQVIDNTVMGKFSGTARSQLRATLRFFGHMSDEGVVNVSLTDLVETFGTDAWQSTLARQIGNAYAPILNGIDLRTATLGQLIERFRVNGGIGGSVLRKAVKFYLSGLKEAGVSVSPHFSTRGLSTAAEGGRAAKKKAATKPAGAVAAGSHPDAHGGSHEAKRRAVPDGVEELTIPLPGGRAPVVQIPLDLTDAEWGFVSTFVKSYMALRPSKK